jgi:hypothetical protein
MPSTPPTTLQAACFWLLGSSLGLVGLRYGLGFLGAFQEMETRHLLGFLGRYRSKSSMDFYSALHAVRGFYGRPSSFLILWFPFLVFCMSGPAISFLKEAGYAMTIWPIAIQLMLLIVTLPMMEYLKYRRMVRMAVPR